jgi:hypothetical protein
LTRGFFRGVMTINTLVRFVFQEPCHGVIRINIF